MQREDREVVGARLIGAELSQRAEDPIDEVFGRGGCVLEGALGAFVFEELVVGVESFGEAVGIEAEGVAGLEGDEALVVEL